MLWVSTKAIWRNLLSLTSTTFPSNVRGRSAHEDKLKDCDSVEDPASPEELVSIWMWLPGLFITITLACLIMKMQYGFPVSQTCLALLMAFLLSFLAIQATGVTGDATFMLMMTS